MKVICERHGETKRGVFWCQIRIGEMRVVGRSFKTERFEDVKRDFKLLFAEEKDANAFASLDKQTISTVQREVKKAWMKVKQPAIEYVKGTRIFFEADPPSCQGVKA